MIKKILAKMMVLTISVFFISAVMSVPATTNFASTVSSSYGMQQSNPEFAGQSAEKKSLRNNDQTLNVNTDMLKWHGPLTAGIQYSKTFGLFLQAKYTQTINSFNAVALALELGKLQRRVNVTWGHIFTSHQRIKLSAENFTQKINFGFDSGDTKQWVDQNAFGFTYAYLFRHHFVHDINLNAYYSHAISRTLDPIIFTQDNLTYLNYRHISGGTDKSASLGLDFLPFQSSLIGFQLNYDNVHYNMRYEDNANDAGLGGTISLQQLLTQHIKFKLLASDRKPYQTYEADLNWLVRTAPGSNLTLLFNTKRIIGNDGTGNDSQVGLDLDYQWDGDAQSAAPTYSLSDSNNMDNLTAWTDAPAVYMQQVLAKLDQKDVLLNNTTFNHHSTSILAANGSLRIQVSPHEAKEIDLNKQLMKAGFAVANGAQYTLTQKPKNHDLTYQKGMLSIHGDSFSQRDQGKSFQLNFASNAKDNIPVAIMVQANVRTPYPNPNYQPDTLFLKAGAYHKQVYDTTLENQLFINAGYDLLHPMTISTNDLQPLGLNYKITHLSVVTHGERVLYPILTIYGVPIKTGHFSVELIPRNKYGVGTTRNLNVIVGNTPRMKIPTQQLVYHQSVHIDLTPYIQTDSDIPLTGAQADLSAYGLKIDYDPTTKQVFLDGTPSKPTITERTVPIEVSNKVGTTQSNFKLDIAGPPIVTNPNLGSQAYHAGDLFMPIPLGDHFSEASAPITSWDLEVKSDDGKIDVKGAEAVKKIFGLEVRYHQLRGIVGYQAKHSPYTVYITAINKYGRSIDQNGNPQTARLHLIIS